MHKNIDYIKCLHQTRSMVPSSKQTIHSFCNLRIHMHKNPKSIFFRNCSKQFLQQSHLSDLIHPKKHFLALLCKVQNLSVCHSFFSACTKAMFAIIWESTCWLLSMFFLLYRAFLLPVPS